MTQEATPAATVRTGEYFYGTGRRKESIARVRIYPGTGTIEVNGRPYLDKFTRNVHQIRVRRALEVADALNKFDVVARINGGGVTGWADALSHGTARALLKYDETLRKQLRAAGLLTRDPRVKERKKVGLKRARARHLSTPSVSCSTDSEQKRRPIGAPLSYLWYLGNARASLKASSTCCILVTAMTLPWSISYLNSQSCRASITRRTLSSALSWTWRM